ncbi:alkaline phosphatase family protein [Sinomonas sp. ASV486]|uniref:bifunctional YncE family protein/alkaline phosphatase family protein n=1 Tax=Sinomonas sp. ASV486 TaxID=3051170 RepID=UPI0027DAC69D|nr:alkaline phosphatase family protein [Sinomonas sp. ASV486]MDQ4489341.1 alkaline phosphatase family protein [Sinomonas sp. ASV486]
MAGRSTGNRRTLILPPSLSHGLRRLSPPRLGRRPFAIVAASCSLALLGGGIAAASTIQFGQNQVGSQYEDGEQISSNQVIKPIGDRLMTPFGKIMGSVVSPDGRYLVGTSADRSVDLQVFDLKTYKPVAAAGTLSATSFTAASTNAGYLGMAYQHISDGSVGQEGPVFSPDGKFLYAPVASGIVRYPFNPDGSLGAGTTISIPAAGGKQALTAGMAFSPDGSTLYAAVNGQNTVVAIDSVAGTVTQTFSTGIAPRQLKFVGTKLYVSNEGGHRAAAGDTTMGSYGTQVPADTYLGTSTSGTVSVIDTASAAAPVSSIDVQLHPTAMHLDGSTLYVANTNSDTVSVIDTATNKVVQTIATQPWASSQVGYAPTAITMQGDHLLVSLGRANAIAVYKVNQQNPKDPASYIGLLPTDYYPENVAAVNGQIVVTNTRGIDARGPVLSFNKGPGTTVATGHGTHSTTASLTKFTLPSDEQIQQYTETVFEQNGWDGSSVKEATAAEAAKIPAVAVPKRIGDPSTIKHVFLIVKENRTYDQVYGDMKQGNGDASLAQFGAKATPNQHALATQFGLYDNTYDIGTNSAEGHNWMMQGDNPAYTETSAGEYKRSYDTEEDVLGHQRSGFLWTSIQSAGNTARNYGEFEYGEGKPAGATWQQYYCAATSTMAGGDPSQLFTPALQMHSSSAIPSLNAIGDTNAAPFDTAVPDIYRYETWKQDFEKNGPKNFQMTWLSSDHTGGTADPEAQVADNDLAVGKIVDEISHSPYWKDSAIFIAEDDSQDGADHVDGHRAPVQVISPYAVHGQTVSTFYSQISMVRTIQQILGAQPLNQKVAAATPMFDAFTNKPDMTPYTAVPNQVPLTEGVKTAPACGLDTLGQTGAAAAAVNTAAAQAAAVPASMQDIAEEWDTWSEQQHLTGNGAKEDFANPYLFNRWTWYQTHGWQTPYPGDAKVYGPNDVPGIAADSTDHADG